MTMIRNRGIPGLIALAASAVALLAGCGSGGATTVVQTVTAPSPASTPTQTETVDKTPPTTTTVPPAVTSTPPRRLKIVRRAIFKTPSRNIGCVLLGGDARCDIRRRDWRTPPRPAGCDLDWGQGVFVGRTGRARFVCAGDTALDPRAPVLAYGTVARYGAFDCTSRTAGITCRNRATGHGFFLARDRYRLF